MTMTVVPSMVEPDAIGPLGSAGKRTSPLRDRAELRNALVGAFRDATDAARDAAANADADPRGAVHDYRKALRRARAVMQLVSDELTKGERRAIRRTLQQARRALGFARDHAVAPGTLEQLELREVERTTAQAVASNAAEAKPPTAEVKQLLAEGAGRALAQVEALEAELPPEIRWSTVMRGVRSTYAIARRARRASKRDASAFHLWRRRSKELAYQLELLSQFAGDDVSQLHQRCETAIDAQGPVVDLIMVREFVRTHSQRIAPTEIGNLLEQIDPHLDDLMTDARRASRDVFRVKPRKFARRLAKAVRKAAAAEQSGT